MQNNKNMSPRKMSLDKMERCKEIKERNKINNSKNPMAHNGSMHVDYTRGWCYSWYDPSHKSVIFSKNTRDDLAKKGCIFLHEYFNGHLTKAHYFRQTTCNQLDTNDLSKTVMVCN